MDLRLHNPNGPAQFFGCFNRFISRKGNMAARHRDTETAQNLLGLIFVNIHDDCPLPMRDVKVSN
jgi:hypothetical protein